MACPIELANTTDTMAVLIFFQVPPRARKGVKLLLDRLGPFLVYEEGPGLVWAASGRTWPWMGMGTP